MPFFAVKTEVPSLKHGEVLSQKKEDRKVHAIQFSSREMTDEERLYSAKVLEELSMVCALKIFQVQLLSDRPFVVYTGALQTAFKRSKYMKG